LGGAHFGAELTVSRLKLSEEKSKWPPKSKMTANFQLFVALPVITFVSLNINRDFGLYT